MSKFSDRFKHAWNAFMNKDPTPPYLDGASYSNRPDRVRFSRGNERTIVTSVYNRISIDCASISVKHVNLDERGRYVSDVDSGLNNCLTVEANIDQTGRALIQDIVQSMMDEGSVAVFPVNSDDDIQTHGSFEIYTLRTAKIIEWYPTKVRLRAYNDLNGQFEEIVMRKDSIAIIENPMYAVMNEPNSTMQRLIRKLGLLDYIDEHNGAGKLDLIIQLPYMLKTDSKRAYAESRKNQIEEQLSKSKHGIVYTDGSEHVTQLNRPVDNQLLSQIETLTRLLYSQLGLTEEIMNGTADEKAMTNYYNRTIEPIMATIVNEFKRKFLTKTARSRGQSVEFFRDPFKLVPTTELAELADKFTRNEIMSSNELRQVVGLQPSDDPKADELRNKNLSPSKYQDQYNIDGDLVEDGEEKPIE